MLKKTSKSFKNYYGCEQVINPDFTKPILIGVFPEDQNISSLNGYMNKLIYLLQIRYTGSVDSDYDIKDMPFDILVRQEKDDIVTPILNLIPENDIHKAKEIIGNINIVSYCAGHDDTAKIIECLYQGLLKKNYTEEESQEIMKQVFVLQVVDNYHNNHELSMFPYVTSIIIHNIHDYENPSYADEEYDENSVFKFKNEDSCLLGLYRSFGQGSLSTKIGSEHDFTYDYIYAPVLNAIMGMILINALTLSKNKQPKDLDAMITNSDVILKEAEMYIEKKGKPLDDYTKEDLEELSNYLMIVVQKWFKVNIEPKLLPQQEKTELASHDNLINEFTILNRYELNYSYILENIKNTIDKIIKFYYEYDKDTISVNIGGNAVLMKEYTKKEYTKRMINDLKKLITELIKKLKSWKLPENMSTEQQSEYNQSIIYILNIVKSYLDNNQLKEIINDCQEEIIVTL
jgi:hypothetical protein